MKAPLLLLVAVALFATHAPAYSQYIYIDDNGDGVCNSYDLLHSGITSLDVYLDTNHDRDGNSVACSDGTNELDIGSYDILLHVNTDSGSVTFNGWTNGPDMPGFVELNAFSVAGNNVGVGYTGSGFLPAGRYKLGTFSVTVTRTPSVHFLTSPGDPAIPSPVTGFGSHCSGTDFPNTVALGFDFFDSCIPTFPVAVESTTWGKIKMTYR